MGDEKKPGFLAKLIGSQKKEEEEKQKFFASKYLTDPTFVYPHRDFDKFKLHKELSFPKYDSLKINFLRGKHFQLELMEKKTSFSITYNHLSVWLFTNNKT